MTDLAAAPRPRIAMVVDNDVTHDSRVLKTAATAAAAGCHVLVAGQSRSAERWSTDHGPLRIVRLPLLEGASRPARILARMGAGEGGSRAAVVRRRAQDGTLLPVLRGRVAERLPERAYPGWRQVFPQFVLLGRAALPLLESFGPDLIHAHDLPALHAGAVARRSTGAELVYDAHEYARGLDTFTAVRRRACVESEAAHIGEASRVITVSPVTAALLEADHGLGYTPEVVLNAPQRRAAGGRGVRAALGLPADVPLLVYAGDVKPMRGLDVVVDALPALPEVQLALVTRPEAAGTRALQARADALGVGRRVHVTPYVPVAQVSAFLAGADAGVSALLRYGNSEATLPTKLFEYLQAGIPVVVSDVQASSELVRSIGFGEPFRAGDAADFARALRLVLERPQRYRATPEALERHSWEAQGKRLLDVYSRLLGPGVALETASPSRVAALLDAASSW
jgi:glycogen(starch) synthase